MSSIIASSSRSVSHSPLVHPIANQQIRTVVHHARPPRVPVLRSPHNPKQPLPTSGTSHPNPSNPPTTTTSTELSDSGLTFHHSPPASAPSYITGSVPPFLSWLSGKPTTLSGDHIAPIRRVPSSIVPAQTPGSSSTTLQQDLGWTEETVNKMVELRKQGKSVNQIGVEMGVPQEARRLISRFAGLSRGQKEVLGRDVERRKDGWGFHKRLAREVRQLRKDFW